MTDRPPFPTFDERRYGASWAGIYDDVYDEFDQALVELLAGFAKTGGSALELAVGTGRVAVPLAGLGVAVTGLDISGEMLEGLAAKGTSVEPVRGDMASFALGREFDLVYVVANSLFALSTQERQVSCFESARAHLGRSGRFLIECFVPDLRRYDSQNTRMSVVSIERDGSHVYEMAIHDPVEQQISVQHVRVASNGETRLLPVDIRYAWPSELDLMARVAGMELEGRWSGFDRSEFDESSTRHVSVYRPRPDA